MAKTQKALLTRDDLIRRMEVPSAAPIQTAMLAKHAEALFTQTIGKISVNGEPTKVNIHTVFEEDVQKRGSRVPPEFKGKPGQVYITNTTEPREILIGTGPREKFDKEAARRYGATAIREAEKLRTDSVSVSVAGAERVGEIVFGAILAAYRFEQKLVWTPDDKPVPIQRLNISGDVSNDERTAKMIDQALLLAGCQNTARYLSDMPADQLNPLHYALLLQQIAHQYEIPYTRIRPNELSSMNLNGIKTVGKGSDHPGSMVLMGHLSTEVEPIVLVGKGLTMDTGGYDVKASGSMSDMFFDMEGSAAVIMAQVGLARMGIRDTLALACIAENKINGRAFVSGDILRIGEKTVTIMHTDAEGRVVLADGLTVASNIVNKEGAVVSIATLTGAAVRALGSGIAAATFSSDQKLVDALNAAAKATGEPVHFFDVHPSLAKLMKGDKSDLVSLAPNGGEAGQTTAAAFLNEFATRGSEKVRHAHVDMAPMMDAHAGPVAEDPRYRKGKFALGYGVNLLVETVNKLR